MAPVHTAAVAAAAGTAVAHTAVGIDSAAGNTPAVVVVRKGLVAVVVGAAARSLVVGTAVADPVGAVDTAVAADSYTPPSLIGKIPALDKRKYSRDGDGLLLRQREGASPCAFTLLR